MGASTPNWQTQEVLLKMEMETEAKATMAEVVANMDSQQKFKKGQLITATISSADDTGVAVLLPLAKKEVILDKDEVDCEVYNKDEFNAKLGEEIELMVVAINPVKLSQKQIKKIKEEEALIADIQAGKDFEVVVATHLNTDNVHNHIVINSVSFKSGYKFYSNRETKDFIRITCDFGDIPAYNYNNDLGVLLLTPKTEG